MPTISIKAELIVAFFGFKLTNSLLYSFIVLFLFLLLAYVYAKQAASKKKGSIYYIVTFALKTLYTQFSAVLKGNTDAFFPLIGAFFLFILLNNWAGLVPGVGSILIRVKEHTEFIKVPLLRGNNADLNATLVLALISFITIQISGIKYQGFGGYIKKFINISNPINFAVGILEIISEFSKIISFSFRLFGNIFAGEVLLTIIAFLIPVAASFPFLLLEIFVGLIQALVFAMLSAVFIDMAVSTSHH